MENKIDIENISLTPYLNYGIEITEPDYKFEFTLKSTTESQFQFLKYNKSNERSIKNSHKQELPSNGNILNDKLTNNTSIIYTLEQNGRVTDPWLHAPEPFLLFNLLPQEKASAHKQNVACSLVSEKVRWG